ncbi:regulatory protein GemA [uncultured Desulfovibrio sp.]|uniref:regulatory protein GemA n=1 Tax=uncultured Desulfovibrio sp. TaxID=167968 RepID=UPI00266EC2BB|nr:regulatory protein GemA [uncultured Desulfovibrio sp.]
MTMMHDNRPMRLGLYRKIEIARKQLPAMDEDAFRALLQNEFGVRSRKEMNTHELSRLVHLFAEMGVEYTAPARARNKAVKPHARPDWIEITDSMPHAREKRAILAIWRKLGYSMTSLDTRVKREFGAEIFVWLQDGAAVSRLLTDLQRREKAFERPLLSG